MGAFLFVFEDLGDDDCCDAKYKEICDEAVENVFRTEESDEEVCRELRNCSAESTSDDFANCEIIEDDPVEDRAVEVTKEMLGTELKKEPHEEELIVANRNENNAGQLCCRR